jgi:hypothetical protein
MEPGASRLLAAWLHDPELQQLIQVNRCRGVLWFNKEAFEQLLWWALVTESAGASARSARGGTGASQDILGAYRTVRELQQAAKESGYQLEALREAAARRQ